MISMKTMTNAPEKHVFVCVNERTDGRDCCADVGGKEIFLELKKFVISHGLAGRIWVTKTGCLGFCNPVGTTIVVYPERKWFFEVTMKDLEHIKELLWQ